MTVLARWLGQHWFQLVLILSMGVGVYIRLENELYAVREQHLIMLHLLCVDHPKDSLCLHPSTP